MKTVFHGRCLMGLSPRLLVAASRMSQPDLARRTPASPECCYTVGTDRHGGVARVDPGGACALLTSALASRPTWTAPAGCVHQWACVAQGRTRMIVFPLRRSVGFKAATA